MPADGSAPSSPALRGIEVLKEIGTGISAIAPILAIITLQQKIATGVLFIVLFGVGHSIPIAVVGSSTAFVRRILENSRFQSGGLWFRRAAAVAIAGLGVYFVLRPFVGGPA